MRLSDVTTVELQRVARILPRRYVEVQTGAAPALAGLPWRGSWPLSPQPTCSDCPQTTERVAVCATAISGQSASCGSARPAIRDRCAGQTRRRSAGGVVGRA